MAMNLRLDPEREKALADEAHRTNRSQADVIRDALDAYLGDDHERTRRQVAALIKAGTVIPARDRTYLRSNLRLKASTAEDWEAARKDRL